MHKVIVGVLFVVVLGSSSIFASFPKQDQEGKIEKTPAKFMQRKLDNSRAIVSGLAQEDYELIEKNAQDLMLLSLEADWKVLKTPEYLKMSKDFRNSASRLRDSAREKNVDGSTLAFFEVTLSCVRCHKYVRSEQEKSKQK